MEILMEMVLFEHLKSGCLFHDEHLYKRSGFGVAWRLKAYKNLCLTFICRQ